MIHTGIMQLDQQWCFDQYTLITVDNQFNAETQQISIKLSSRAHILSPGVIE